MNEIQDVDVVKEISLEEIRERRVKREVNATGEDKNILAGMFQNAGIEMNDPSKLKASKEYSQMQWNELQAMGNDCKNLLGEIGKTYLEANRACNHFTSMGYVMSPEAANAVKVIGSDINKLIEKYEAITARYTDRLGTIIEDDDIDMVSNIFTEYQILTGHVRDMGNNLLTITAEAGKMHVWYNEKFTSSEPTAAVNTEEKTIH